MLSPRQTIDELPLEWFFGRGVVLDMTAKDLGASGYDRTFGFGRVDAAAAVAAAAP